MTAKLVSGELFKRTMNVGDNCAIEVAAFERGHAYLTAFVEGDRMGFGFEIEELDALIDTLKRARRAIRDHQFKGKTDAERGPQPTDHAFLADAEGDCLDCVRCGHPAHAHKMRPVNDGSYEFYPPKARKDWSP